MIYEKYVGEIFAYSYYLCGKKHDAEDLVSMTFMRALEKLHTFNGDSSKIRSWLYTIARNLFIDQKRKEKNKHINVDAEFDLPDNEDMEHRQDIKVMLERIIEYVNDLEPPIYAEILLLRYKQELSVNEISLILNKKEQNIRTILHRATSKLKDIVYKNEV